MNSTIIGWIITLIFGLILLGGFGVGFWRGFKRSTASLIFSLAGVVLAFFITPPITNAILRIEVGMNGGSVPLYNILLEALLANADIKLMISKNPNLELLVTNIPGAVLNTLIFIVITLIVEFVAYLIFKVICVAVIKDKDGKCVGGLLGVVKAFIVTVVACMPLASLVGLANKIITTNDYGIENVAVIEAEVTAEESEESPAEGEQTPDTTTPQVKVVTKGLARDYVPNAVIMILEGFENNLLTKCSSMFGLDDKMFDYYGSVKLKDGKVAIREEIENLYNVADFGYQMTKYGVKDVDYTKVNYDKVHDAVKSLTSSNLFTKVVSPSMVEVVTNSSSYSFMSKLNSYKEILDNVGAQLATMNDKSAYFREDLLNVVDSVRALGKGGAINDVLALESKTPAKIADTLTSADNIEAFGEGLKNILKLNTFKDSASVVMKKVVEKVELDVDTISVNGRAITDEEWEEIKTSLTAIVKDFGTIANEVNLNSLVSDATILLDKEANYDIDKITVAFGNMIDELRANKLLRTSEGKPVIDKLIESNNLKLTEESVVDKEGKTVQINGYEDAFKFVAPSLRAIRDEGIYELVDKQDATAGELISSLAAILSKEGKQDVLSDIVLPLYQINFTKTLVVDKLSNSVSGDFVNLNDLKDYNSWKSDLKDISSLMVTLHGLTYETQTYLDLVLANDFITIYDNIAPERIGDIVTPILTAVSTSTLRTRLFEDLKVEIDSLSDEAVVIDLANVKFTGEESQTAEVCEVFKRFLVVNRTIPEGGSIRDAESDEQVAALFEAMKANAYRTENGKADEGLFKDAYVKLVKSFKNSYADEVALLEANADKLAELGVENLNEENFDKINFVKLLEMLKENNSEVK